MVGIIVLRVVPEFGDFYDGLGAELPLGTRVIVATSEALRQNLLTIIILVAGGGTLGWAWLRQPGSRAMLDRLLLEIPGVGGIARKVLRPLSWLERSPHC